MLLVGSERYLLHVLSAVDIEMIVLRAYRALEILVIHGMIIGIIRPQLQSERRLIRRRHIMQIAAVVLVERLV
jgi:hypothetical protein